MPSESVTGSAADRECLDCGHWARHHGPEGCTVIAGTVDGLGDTPCPCTNRPPDAKRRDARYDGATDEQVAETILADLNYKRMPYERALIVTTAHVQGIRAAVIREATDG